jgi:glycosyltransferase involved in cell wall biosynthesis
VAEVRVVMLVSNDARTDARVRKSALAVAATGAEVTLVALAPDGVRTDEMLGPVRITRVPVDFALRDASRARDRHRRADGVPGLRPLTAEREAALRRELAARRRDRIGDADPDVRERVQHHYLRGRRFAGRAGARVSRAIWGATDRVKGEVSLGARWRRELPQVNDYELGYGPVVDALGPDVIHAHDVEMLPVAARAAARAAAEGRPIRWIYDAHEWVAGLSQYAGRTRRAVAAWASLEAEYIRRADAVITVSDDLADALQRRYQLAARPTVVLNIPPFLDSAAVTPDVRTAAGVPEGAPLLVYSGGVQAARGVQTAVAALTSLHDAHLAVVAVPSVHSHAMRAIAAQAASLGVADRVHPLDPVPPQEVVSFLRTADVGLIPLRHYGSHEFALANKLFEYLHAGVPMVVSDCRAQAHFVREHGLGEVHTADDPEALAAAVRAVLARQDQLRAHLAVTEARETFTWPRQALAIQRLYGDLLDGALTGPAVADPAAGVEPPTTAYSPPPRAPRLGIGPVNSAGQAWAWTQAVRRADPRISTQVVAIINGTYDYGSDTPVTPWTFAHDPTWGLNLREAARETWTHALIEAGRPLFGGLSGPDARADVAALQAAGIRVGLVFHGSEVRDPRRHAVTHEFSPFRDPRDPYTKKLQDVADRTLALARDFDGPVFVSTPDQLEYLPEATWLPVVVDPTAWPLEVRERDRPLVVHAPSNPRLKGTTEIERALDPFIAAGRITYQRITGMQPAEAAALIRDADIVIDQVLLGLYGVLACEGLASGAVVLGHVGNGIRSRVPDEIPIIEATPTTLSRALEQVLQDLAQLRAAADRRRAFVERWHDGRASSRVILEFMGQGPGPAR